MATVTLSLYDLFIVGTVFSVWSSVIQHISNKYLIKHLEDKIVTGIAKIIRKKDVQAKQAK